MGSVRRRAYGSPGGISGLGRRGGGRLQLLVEVDDPNGGDVVVGWSTADVTAIRNQDYLGASGILTIPGGQTSGVIEIEIVDWALVEDSETFLVTISDPTNASLGQPSSCEVTIVDDDVYPELHCEYTEQTFLESDGTRGVYLLLSLVALSVSGQF